MHQSLFFRLFPPPKYMAMRFSGLEISDDAIRCLRYAPTVHGLVIDKYDETKMPSGVMQGGDLKDENTLKDLLTVFAKKNRLTYVNVSVPEEKAYLFQTDVIGNGIRDIAQNIEFKLEENVPLSAKDAVFYFDLLPFEITGGVLRASVSVVPKTFIEKEISFLQSCDLSPIAFEVAPKSIARSVLENDPNRTSSIVHIMDDKCGVYIVSGGVVCFTSTIDKIDAETVAKEIEHTCEYWVSRSSLCINEIVLTGRRATEFAPKLADLIARENRPIIVGDTWHNAFDINSHIPPISRSDSLDYAVVAGLALDS